MKDGCKHGQTMAWNGQKFGVCAAMTVAVAVRHGVGVNECRAEVAVWAPLEDGRPAADKRERANSMRLSRYRVRGLDQQAHRSSSSPGAPGLFEGRSCEQFVEFSDAVGMPSKWASSSKMMNLEAVFTGLMTEPSPRTIRRCGSMATGNQMVPEFVNKICGRDPR